MYSGHSDLLCAKASRAIVNYTPISEYCLRFFPRKDFACFYTLYPIKTRRHILYKCKRYNNYQSLRRELIAHFTLFLEFNREKAVLNQFVIYSFSQLFPIYSFILFLFLLLFFHSLCYFNLNLCNYMVVTPVCQQALHNKLLIFKKRISICILCISYS